MARAGETPHDAYYGSVDSTPLWLILLGETHAWTGDDALLDRLWPNALAALAWIDDSGDLDGDGFVEYERRSQLGLLNQGWKDSGDAIRHTDGRPADGPIALAEVQGYVYAAKRAMARLARHRGEIELAARLDVAADDAADRLRRRRSGCPRRASTRWPSTARSARSASIGSNAGQALWTGIVPAERAARVAERLLEPDMFSGWGIRTFASGQPGYNPVGYHTGSIWPHDNALIAAGSQGQRRGRRREPARRPAHRGRPVVPGPAPARAVLRVRPDGRRGAGRLSGRLLAAGLGGRRAVLPAPHDARPARRRDGPAARAHPPDPARLARQADHHRACRSATTRSTCWSIAGVAGRAPSSSAGAARSTSSSTPEREPGATMTDPTSTTGTIVVGGTGRVAVEPDVADLRLGRRHRAADAWTPPARRRPRR